MESVKITAKFQVMSMWGVGLKSGVATEDVTR